MLILLSIRMLMLFLHELLLRQILSPCGFILVWFKLRTAVNNFIPITIQFHVGGCWLPVQPVEKCLHIYSVTPRITISSQAWFICRFDKCAPSLWVNNIPPKRKGEKTEHCDFIRRFLSGGSTPISWKPSALIIPPTTNSLTSTALQPLFLYLVS